MNYLIRQMSTRIVTIIYQLEFDEFMSFRKRASLERELSSLIEKRANAIKTLEQMKANKE